MAQSTTTTETTISDEPIIQPEPEIIVENKTYIFDAMFGDMSGTTSISDMIAKQKAEIAAEESKALADKQSVSIKTNSTNICNQDLRDCMTSSCGNDYTNCENDTITAFNKKIDSCRAKTNCSDTEYKLFAPEIVADKDISLKLSDYTNTINCGNRYNTCMVGECGMDFSRCLGKQYENAAIATCETIADECREYDTGFVSRTSSILATLRVSAEENITDDEDRLYELRELMEDSCKRIGAVLDTRSLDCVTTVEMFANNGSEPVASRKIYAGSAFDCTPEWFGVDITTYAENAARLTRDQKSATSSMLGAGIGTGAGAIISNPAMDKIKAFEANQ